MPIKIPDQLPARQTLESENIFVMNDTRATTQNIRPLRIIIMNLMPNKETTETQLLRVIGNTPLQIEVTLLRPATHFSTHTPQPHLQTFYKTFDEIRDERFDGLIITGAPVEQMEFEEVHYWNELHDIIRWGKTHVFSTFYICWAAQAGLYTIYGIEKHPLDQKCSGVYLHHILDRTHPLVRGFDSEFFAPHSRHTEIRREDIDREPRLKVLAESDQAGVYLIASTDGKNVFVTGHSEYDPDTLKNEYFRDIGKGMDVPVPCNYFPDDDPTREPVMRWRAHSNLLFQNWLNYFVYQETPYDLNDMQVQEEDGESQAHHTTESTGVK